MNRSDVIILRQNTDDDFGRIIEKRGYMCFAFYRHQKNVISRSFRRIWDRFGLPFASIWYDKAVLKCDANHIVVFDALCNVRYLKWLRKRKPEARIVVWYWNIIKHSFDPNTIPDSICDKWSFSRVDCEKYGMRFNPLPYFTEIDNQRTEKEYDVVFVGRDKGRLDALVNLKHQFENMGFTTKFVIAPTYRYENNPEYSKPVSYMESVALGNKGRAILDYIEVNNSGQSIRVIEALFLREKIITNSCMVFDYDFYCPENIFVLGHDSFERLPEFLCTPYKDISQEIIKQYDFDSAIERFFSDKRTVFDDMLEQLKGKSHRDVSEN